MEKKFIDHLEKKLMLEKEMTREEALELIDIHDSDIFDLFVAANRIKEHFVGKKVHLCSIINAKSGRCPEDCGFCAQSSRHKTDIPVYDMVSVDEIIKGARFSEKNKATCFGIVTSGKTIKDEKDLDIICAAIKRIRNETEISPSASLGMVSYEQAIALKEAGLVTYHHNIETSRNYFPNVCTTHSYDDDLETIKNIKRAGLKVCSGVIFGLGEEKADWVDMAFTLKELDVDSVPINFLNPVKNTKFEDNEPIPALELLKGVALFRFILPAKKISVCGGRERNLRGLQSYMFLAGANGTMAGNYLTTKGRDKEEDMQMIRDLGLEAG
jgi:biotin synthase